MGTEPEKKQPVKLKKEPALDDAVQAYEQRIASVFAHMSKISNAASLTRLGSKAIPTVPIIPTGSLRLDAALGIGGYPQGRIVEIFGPESAGKTTLTLHAIAQAQQLGGIVAFIDAEHALDIRYASNLGVRVKDLLVSQPDYGEQALEAVSHLTGTLGANDLIGVDSVAALVPKAELEGDIGDAHMGIQARLMSQALRMITAKVASSGVTVLFTNQLRDKIGGYGGKTTTGGNALRFYASVRIEIARIGQYKVGDASVGNQVRMTVSKNKLAPPFVQAESVIRFGTGISILDELLDMGSETEVIEKSGSWYSYKDERLGQGRENAIANIRGRPDLYAELVQQIRAKLSA